MTDVIRLWLVETFVTFLFFFQFLELNSNWTCFIVVKSPVIWNIDFRIFVDHLTSLQIDYQVTFSCWTNLDVQFSWRQLSIDSSSIFGTIHFEYSTISRPSIFNTVQFQDRSINSHFTLCSNDDPTQEKGSEFWIGYLPVLSDI